MSLLPKSIHRCRRYPTQFNSGRDIPSEQVRVVQNDLMEHGFTKVGVAQVRAVELRADEGRPLEPSVAQIDAVELRCRHAQACEIGCHAAVLRAPVVPFFDALS